MNLSEPLWRHAPSPATAQDSDPGAVPARLGAGLDLTPREQALYLRYVRALALLCECASYVDEPDYADRIDEVLADAARHYPLAWRREGERCEIAPRAAGSDAGRAAPGTDAQCVGAKGSPVPRSP